MESSVTAEGPLRVAWCQPFTCSPLARWEHKQSPARTLPIADYLCLHPRCEPINLLSLDHFDQALFDFYRILPFCFFFLECGLSRCCLLRHLDTDHLCQSLFFSAVFCITFAAAYPQDISSWSLTLDTLFSIHMHKKEFMRLSLMSYYC